MSYEILLKPAAQRQLKKLPGAVQRELIALIEQLSQDPDHQAARNSRDGKAIIECV